MSPLGHVPVSEAQRRKTDGPSPEREQLRAQGVAEVFTPGASTGMIVEFLPAATAVAST